MKAKRKDARKFRHYARSTKKVNVTPKTQRGGLVL